MTQHQGPASSGDELVVIPLPAEIDLANAAAVGRELSSALATGAGTVVADLTGTTFCDSAGTRVLAMAFLQAMDSHIDLRLAIPGVAVRRALKISGLNHVLPVFPSLDDALAPSPA